MTTQAVTNFLESVKESEELQSALTKAMEADNDRQAVVELASNRGFDFTSDELWGEVQRRQEERQNGGAGELSDEELESVAGGEFLLGSAVIASAGLSAAITGAAPAPKW